jgi:hypothetical protein
MDMLETLRARRGQADEYATAKGLDQWGTRVAWFVVSEGVSSGRLLCSRYNKQSNAWRCYQNLVSSGIIVEGPEGGIRYTPSPMWEDGDGPLRWFEAVATVAAGGPKHPLL